MSVELRDGQACSEDFRRLLSRGAKGRRIESFDSEELGKSIDKFKSIIAFAYAPESSPFEHVSFIGAFLAAASGFDDGLPIHYPRKSKKRDAVGENFKWFVQNDKPERQIALQALYDPEKDKRDEGLPFFPD